MFVGIDRPRGIGLSPGLSMNGFSSLPSTVPRRLRYDSFWEGWITWGGRLIVGTIDGRAPAFGRGRKGKEN